MLQITENNGELHITPLNPPESQKKAAQHFSIEKPEEVVIIGKNSIFDNNRSKYFSQRTINFKGSIYADLKDEIKLKIYKLEADIGFLVHNEINHTVYVSRSFSLLNDYCLAQKISLVGIIVTNCPQLKLQEIIINNDFTRNKISNDSIDPEKCINFSLDWNENEQQIPFGMIIESNSYVANHDNPFFNEFNGIAINIGHFRQLVVKEKDIRYPDFFPERDINHCIIFTNLFDDNLLNVLGPEIMDPYECQMLLNNMKHFGKTNMIFTGISSSGFGVQAHIQLLDDSESTPNYQAKVTKLIISPSASITYDFPFHDR